MPTCTVVQCGNNSVKQNLLNLGISYHRFPVDPNIKEKWIHATGRKNWVPSKPSTICSKHFQKSDFIFKKGIRFLNENAVPTQAILCSQDSSDFTSGKTPPLKVCRICLVSCYRKMFSLKLNHLKQAYKDLIGVKLENEERLPQTLCWECAARLLSHSRFRSRSLRAHSIMTEMLDKQHNLTKENLARVNREDNQLSSSLKVEHYEVDYYDVHIICTDYDEELKENEMLDLNTVESVKSETGNELYVDEDEPKVEMYIDRDEVKRGESEDDENLHESDAHYLSQVSVILDETGRNEKAELNELVEDNKKQVKKQQAGSAVRRSQKPLSLDLDESYFTVTELTFEEQVEEFEKRRESSKYKNAVLRCTQCYKTYINEDAYKSHMMRHTNIYGIYKCKVCKLHFKKNHELQSHINACHKERFTCNQCPYTTMSRHLTKRHFLWHKGAKYSCPHCDLEFLKFTTYMSHLRVSHPSDFVCELCGFSFVSAKGKLHHKKLKHKFDNTEVPDDGPYCELCDLRFISVEALERHQNVSARHNSAETGRGREPNTDQKLRKHKVKKRRKIDLEEPIQCEQCDMVLKDAVTYNLHFKRMHPDKNRTNYPTIKDPCMCEECGKIFQNVTLVKYHKRVHTGERPFVCDQCNKSFRTKMHLVTHILIHEGKSYPCELCGKNYSSTNNLQRHVHQHSGLKPYTCEICMKAFKTSTEKKTHVTYVHMKVPWPKRNKAKRGTEKIYREESN